MSAGRFPQSFLDDLRARVKLSDVAQLAWDRHKSNIRTGDYWACCPFHGEKTASFHCDDGKGLYHCFGCKSSGDVIAWLIEAKGMQFGEAVAELARRAGLALPAADPQEAAREARRKSLYEVLAAAQAWFLAQLLDPRVGIQARAYLATRDLPEATWERFGLGYAPASGLRLALKEIGDDLLLDAGILGKGKHDGRLFERFRDRLIFPIHDAQARVVGFAGRALRPEQEPKYLNSPETALFDKGRLLFNRHRAAELAREQGQITIVEGYMDVIAVDRLELPAVAPMGTALTGDQLEAIWRLAPEPVLCLDGDAAGKAASERAIDAALPLLQPGRSLSICTLPENKDPDEYLKSQENAKASLSKLLKSAVPLFEALFVRLTRDKDVSTPERRAALNAEIEAAVAMIAHADVRQAYQLAMTDRLVRFWKEKGERAAKPKFKKPPKDARGGGGDGEDDAGDDEVKRINENYAVVLVGQKGLILEDGEGVAVSSFEKHRFISVDAFKLWHANRWMPRAARSESIADYWLKSPRRRQYRGIEFWPMAPGEPGRSGGYYNLWHGFDVQPRKNRELALPWLDHVQSVICNHDDELFNWVVSWFAAILQRPRERYGTSLVLRGGEGAGKTLTGQIIGGLISSAYFLIDDPRYIMGQFNSHLASCLLLQADEGFWAGDKQAEARLKGLITSDFQMIEPKGVDPVRVANYAHLLVTSNSDWVVPVGVDGRRYCVIDVSMSRRQDLSYFAKLTGLYSRSDAKAALLHELLSWRVDDQELRRVPKTAALFEQKVESFDHITEYVFELLQRGSMPGALAWPQRVKTDDLHDSYVKRCERMHVRRPAGAIGFGRKLVQLIPGIRKHRQRRTEDGHARFYVFPKLEQARAEFSAFLQQEIDWGDSLPELPPMIGGTESASGSMNSEEDQ